MCTMRNREPSTITSNAVGREFRSRLNREIAKCDGAGLQAGTGQTIPATIADLLQRLAAKTMCEAELKRDAAKPCAASLK